MSDAGQPTIHVVAAFTTDPAGLVLLVRKAGSVSFMQPGGKPDEGEDAAQALVREIAEELQIEVDRSSLVAWGRYQSMAANEPGHRLTADVFGLRLTHDQASHVEAAAEIEEARWVSREEARALGGRLAPLAHLLLDEPEPKAAFVPFDFDSDLHTDRLRLRPMTAADAPAIHRYQSREDVCAYLLFEPRTLAQVTERVERHAASLRLGAVGDYLQIAVERTADGQLIGDVYVAVKSLDNLTAELGWTFHPDVHGQGYASEAAAAVMDLLFTRIGIHRVIAEYDPRNHASIALCERLGMRHEAFFRQDLWFRGGWADTGIHAITAEEYAARPV